VAKSSISMSQKPDRLLLLRNACSFQQYPPLTHYEFIIPFDFSVTLVKSLNQTRNEAILVSGYLSG